MNNEMQSIHTNDTWILVNLPTGHRAIELKWVFKMKKDHAGNIIKYKACLVTKGYAQLQWVDFDKVFTPVARMETMRLLNILVVHGGWQVYHMDIKSMFLNGNSPRWCTCSSLPVTLKARTNTWYSSCTRPCMVRGRHYACGIPSSIAR